MVGLIAGLAISWYFFNFMENNTYIKNVAIYSVVNFIVATINQLIEGSGLHIITSIIASIIGGLIIVKVMEFAKGSTKSLVGFIIVTEVCVMALSFCISFIIYRVLM